MSGPRRKTTFRIPAGTNVHRTSNCRSCGAEILWIGSIREGGKNIPIHVASMERAGGGGWVGESHFAHCPQAGQWRRGRS